MKDESKQTYADRALTTLVSVIPRVAVTRAVGRLMDVPIPLSARRTVIGGFSRTIGANASEHAGSFEDYGTLGDYFARPLREGVRPWPEDPAELPSPCDGYLASCTEQHQGRLPIVKGAEYSLADFVANDELAERLKGGSEITVYLSPSDYHRVHVPIDARLERVVRLGADLWPVRPALMERRPATFVENERVLFVMENDVFGLVVLAMVGATVVGSVDTSLPASGGVDLQRGDELGAFRLGSTVVLLTERTIRRAATAPGDGEAVLMGADIAEIARG